ncbi:hypothetical protein GCM10017600_03760 [Streptosporangium carneum]|uniref:Uncharacterized protein n=2 Tax=Streptosporangium carneum TaxID=47481 RepID=A0A9W6MAE7_9ACTN|nr:hypothetical protein GCM10017600_03760 [Streptosporangium carneum]
MVTRFKRAAEDSDLVDVARRVGRTPLEIMTIASIVQAESTDKRDMPKIARVWRQARGARDAALLDP